MPTYTESDIEAAIDARLNGLPLRRAAAQFGIPESSLRKRLLGARSQSTAQQDRQRLSINEERQLATWILSQERLGYCPTYRQVRYIATKMLLRKGDTRDLGRHWLDSFFRRNPDVKTKIGVRIEAARINRANPATINAWFDLYDTFDWIQPANIYNTDETGIMEGMGLNGLVVGSSKINPTRAYIKGSQSRNWTTIIECIGAAGVASAAEQQPPRALTPVVIFKGASVQQQWFKREFNHPWLFTSSENGWTSNEIAIEWLNQVFIPETAP